MSRTTITIAEAAARIYGRPNRGGKEMRKKVHTICTIAAVVFCTVCIIGIIHTWWIAAIIYALAMIFLILAFATSKEAERAIKEEEKPKRVSPIEYVNVDEPSWTECYMIALRKEIDDNAQM